MPKFKGKFEVGDFVEKQTLLYRDPNDESNKAEFELRRYLVLKVSIDQHGSYYRLQQFIDGVAEDFTTIMNVDLLDRHAKLIGHVDFSIIENYGK